MPGFQALFLLMSYCSKEKLQTDKVPRLLKDYKSKDYRQLVRLKGISSNHFGLILYR